MNAAAFIMLMYGVSLFPANASKVDEAKGSGSELLIIGGTLVVFCCFLRFSAKRGGNSERSDISGIYLQIGMIIVGEISREPDSFCVNMLGVETVAFECFPIALFGTKPKSHGEGSEPLTDGDVFIEAVWSSGMVSKIAGVLAVVQAIATVMHGSMEAVPRGNVRDSVSQLIAGFVSRSHGSPSTIEAEGCNLVTSKEIF